MAIHRKISIKASDDVADISDEDDEMFFDAQDDEFGDDVMQFEPELGLKLPQSIIHSGPGHQLNLSQPFKNQSAVDWWKFAITCVIKDIRV